MSFPYIIQGQNVTVVIDSKPHTVSKTHVTYDKIVSAIRENDWATGGFVASFFYNKVYIKNLISKGYKFLEFRKRNSSNIWVM